jgi:transcriptional regulator with XRE-family HTH domain
MARAGKALRQVLETYNISQNQLAVTMGIDRSNVSRWISESRDPSAEAAVEIKQALETIDPAAAEAFVKLYMYGLGETDRS